MALIMLRFRVKYADGKEVEVATRPKELIGFERTYGISLSDAERWEHTAFMAWLCLHNRGQEPRDFDSFVDVIDECEQLEDEAANPTSEGQSPG